MTDEINPYNAGPFLAPLESQRPIAGTPMSVAFEVTVEDTAAAALHYGSSPLTAQRWAGCLSASLLVLLPAGILWSALTFLLDAPLEISTALAAVLMLLVSSGCAPLARLAMVSLHARRFADPANRNPLGPCEIAIDGEGLHQRLELVRRAWKWEAIVRIDLAEKYAFFYLAAEEGILLPGRAFGSQEHLQTFVASARQFHEHATYESSPHEGGAAQPGEPSVLGSPTAIAYRFEIEDLAAAIHHVWQSSPAVARWRCRFAIAGCLLMALSAAALWFNAPTMLAIAGGLCGAALMLRARQLMSLKALAAKYARRHAAKASRQLFGTWQIAIESDGMWNRSALSETFWKWLAIHRIDQTAEHALLYIATDSALAIPGRAFSDRASFDAFVAAARRFHQQASRG